MIDIDSDALWSEAAKRAALMRNERDAARAECARQGSMALACHNALDHVDAASAGGALIDRVLAVSALLQVARAKLAEADASNAQAAVRIVELEGQLATAKQRAEELEGAIAWLGAGEPSAVFGDGDIVYIDSAHYRIGEPCNARPWSDAFLAAVARARGDKLPEPTDSTPGNDEARAKANIDAMLNAPYDDGRDIASLVEDALDGMIRTSEREMFPAQYAVSVAGLSAGPTQDSANMANREMSVWRKAMRPHLAALAEKVAATRAEGGSDAEYIDAIRAALKAAGHDQIDIVGAIEAMAKERDEASRGFDDAIKVCARLSTERDAVKVGRDLVQRTCDRLAKENDALRKEAARAKRFTEATTHVAETHAPTMQRLAEHETIERLTKERDDAIANLGEAEAALERASQADRAEYERIAEMQCEIDGLRSARDLARDRHMEISDAIKWVASHEGAIQFLSELNAVVKGGSTHNGGFSADVGASPVDAMLKAVARAKAGKERRDKA